MFTGIIEEVGRVVAVPPRGRAGELAVACSRVLEGTATGDSIAVNGVCLTVTSFDRGEGFRADVMPETLSRSGLGRLFPGAQVNLERAMAADGRFGGHIVSGHIDGTGTVAGLVRDQNAVRVRIRCGEAVARLVVEKGSIAIDGVSLTVSRLFDDGFEVSVIPHTAGQTTLLLRRVGDTVNLENDVVGKYVQRLLATAGPAQGPSRPEAAGSSGITLEYLRSRGF